MKKSKATGASLIILMLFLVGCSGISLIGDKKESDSYSNAFVLQIKDIKKDFSEGHVDLAIARLQKMDEKILNPAERAFRRNLMGVILFGKKSYEQAIFNFDQALKTSLKDTNLTAQIYLNLASSYYKLGHFEKSFENLEAVGHNNLYPDEKKKFNKLKYLISMELGKSREMIVSLIHYLGHYKKVNNLKIDPYFERLQHEFSRLDKREKLKVLEENGERPILIIAHLSYLEAEKFYYEGDKDTAEDLFEWLKSDFSHYSEINELVENFYNRAENYSKLDHHSIGIILPLSGKNQVFGNRALLGIDSSLRFKDEDSPYKLFVKDSKGDGNVGAFQVKRLIEKNFVSVIIGGLFSNEATNEYLEARKHGVFFVSLSEIHLPKEKKDHLLLEIPGSIESQVDQLFNEEMLNFFGRRSAIIYPKNDRGWAYMNEFWRKAKLKGVAVTGALSFDPKQSDYRDPVKNLLGLKFPRERKEELELLTEIYSLERKRGTRRVQVLRPQIDFDWVFLPVRPEHALQLVPSFSYYDAFRINMIGGPNWRSHAFTSKSSRLGKMYFVGNDMASGLADFVDYFKEKYKKYPRIVEKLSFDAFTAVKNVLQDNVFKNRDELNSFIHSKTEIRGAKSIWKFNEGIWIKDLASLRIKNGRIEKLGLSYATDITNNE